MAIDLQNGYTELMEFWKSGVRHLQLVAYGDPDNPDNLTIEAANEVVIDFDRPSQEERLQLPAVGAVATISASHVPAEDWWNLRRIGESNDKLKPVYRLTSGSLLIEITDDYDPDEWEDFTDVLRDLLRQLQENEINGVVLDVDGPIIEGLRTHTL